MKRQMRHLLFAVLSMMFYATGISKADTLTVGALLYDTGVVPGLDSFDLYNLTYGFQSPDGIADLELLSGSLTVDLSGGATAVYNFSDIDNNGGTIATVLPGEVIVSATLSVTLSNYIGVNILDDLGNPGVANLQAVSNTSLPTVGSALFACDGSGSACSESIITVDTSPAVGAVPEPPPLLLMGTGLTLLGVLFRLAKTRNLS
jgi:hypothetical protein